MTDLDIQDPIRSLLNSFEPTNDPFPPPKKISAYGPPDPFPPDNEVGTAKYSVDVDSASLTRYPTSDPFHPPPPPPSPPKRRAIDMVSIPDNYSFSLGRKPSTSDPFPPRFLNRLVMNMAIILDDEDKEEEEEENSPYLFGPGKFNVSSCSPNGTSDPFPPPPRR